MFQKVYEKRSQIQIFFFFLSGDLKLFINYQFTQLLKIISKSDIDDDNQFDSIRK